MLNWFSSPSVFSAVRTALHTCRTAVLTFLLLSLVSACSHKTEHTTPIKIARFENVIFSQPGDESDRFYSQTLPLALRDFSSQFSSPLIHNYPDDPGYIQNIRHFRNDTVVQALFHAVSSRYHDLSWLESQLSQALAIAHSLDTNITLRQVATYIGSAGYQSRVSADRESQSLVIVIDQYVAPLMKRFGYFGDPLYLVHLSDSAYILPDCMAAIAQQYVTFPQNDPSLLDYMVAEGKVLYFLQQTLPNTPDSIWLRYTPQQLAWMQHNEANVWGYFVQNKMLFCNDFSLFRNFVDEAPKTNAFRDSAPRTANFIGFKIVSAYMKKSHASLHDLFAEPDAQKILNLSNYHP